MEKKSRFGGNRYKNQVITKADCKDQLKGLTVKQDCRPCIELGETEAGEGQVVHSPWVMQATPLPQYQD